MEKYERTAIAVGSWITLLIRATLPRVRAASDSIRHARQAVVLGVGKRVAVRHRVCRTVVSDLRQRGVGIVDLLLVHGAVLAVRLAIAGDHIGIEEPAGRVGIGVGLSVAGS